MVTYIFCLLVQNNCKNNVQKLYLHSFFSNKIVVIDMIEQ